MSPARAAALVFVLLLARGAAARAEARVERFAGVATGEDGSVAYRETHEEVYENGALIRSRTIYYDASGAEIGQLDSDYRSSLYAPTYTFQDERSGETERARVEGRWLVLERGEEQERVLPRGKDPVVLGQGLHHLLRTRLEELSNSPLRVQFGMPGRLAVYLFRIRPLRSPEPGVVRLRIEPDDWFLRLLAPRLEVDYDLASGRLLRYSGLSNLEGPDGKSEKVMIRYRYGAQS